MTQFFKGDAQELKFFNSGNPIATALSNEKSTFFDEAYSSFVLGEVLYDTNRAPLANSILREIYREAFSAIFNSFVFSGSLEGYISVFKNIFGNDVIITFTVPSPGKLGIDIVAAGLELYNWQAREIISNSYVLSDIVDDVSDNIVFQAIKGFESQYELEQMLKEMVPAGIYTEISLTVGV